jgi:hypothetical protein
VQEPHTLQVEASLDEQNPVAVYQLKVSGTTLLRLVITDVR